MKHTALLSWTLVAFTASSLLTAGTPAQDKNVRELRALFTQGLDTHPREDFVFTGDWHCTGYNAFKNDFYIEHDTTFRLAPGPTAMMLKNTGNSIFKDFTITAEGLQSAKANEAYDGNVLYLTLRPYFTYKKAGGGKAVQDVKAVRLIGEVIVAHNMLACMARYYGYDRPFEGIPAVMDRSMYVYNYVDCRPSNPGALDRAEERSRGWSIPAELRRSWPKCVGCR